MATNDFSRDTDRLDVLIIGAGVAGLCALYRLREMGLTVHALESADNVGGVWYWNRYPGARFDSESYTYCYSFSPELLQEWTWSERFAAQPEVLSYLNHVADRFDLRQSISFGSRVVATHFDERTDHWQIETASGRRYQARFLVTALGTLSACQLPAIEGIADFEGECYHTGRWPQGGVSLTGRQVGVIGTGATGVQLIQTIAADVSRLTVFQRTPTYCIPQRNSPLEAEEWLAIRRRYPEILERCNRTYGGFIHEFDPRSGLAVSEAERMEKFEELWRQPGFAFWFGNFSDLLMDSRVNEYACKFLREKIRERIRDPETARKLLPTHPFGTKRVPLENGYYEVYNRQNVELVDLRETPIEHVHKSGVRTSNADYPLDVLICATGYDAVTGPLMRLDIRGLGGLELREKWRSGPHTYLGLQIAGFPNLFTLAGPQNAAALCNAVRCTEQNVDWLVKCLGYMRDRGFSRITATEQAAEAWARQVQEAAANTLLDTMTDSWFYGANTPGKPRAVLVYAAGASEYREQCEIVAREGYRGFEFA